MTTICALRTDAGVWIASDQLSSWNNHVAITGGKFVIEDGCAVGLAGCGRARRLLQADCSVGATVDEFRHNMIAAWRACGFDEKSEIKDGFPEYPSSGIWTDGSAIWEIGGGGFVPSLAHEPFVADGSGNAYAYGAYEALRTLLGPEALVRRCVEAAIRWDCRSGGDAVAALIPRRG